MYCQIFRHHLSCCSLERLVVGKPRKNCFSLVLHVSSSFLPGCCVSVPPNLEKANPLLGCLTGPDVNSRPGPVPYPCNSSKKECATGCPGSPDNPRLLIPCYKRRDLGQGLHQLPVFGDPTAVGCCRGAGSLAGKGSSAADPGAASGFACSTASTPTSIMASLS